MAMAMAREGRARSAANSTGLTSLPLEVLVRVLVPLSPQDWARAAQVCTVLRAACIGVLGTVTSLDLKNAGVSLDDSCFALLCTRLGSNCLRRLELDCWHLSDGALKNLPEGLEELALCGCDRHSDDLLVNVARRTHATLWRFAWSGCGMRVTSLGFHKLARQCKNITSFLIDNGASGTDVNAVVCAVASNCPALTELSAYDLTSTTFLHIRSCNVELKKLRHKRRVDLALAVTDITLCLLISMCPLLEELHLVDKSDSYIGEVSDIGLLALTKRSCTLRSLKLKLAWSRTAERCSEGSVMELACSCKHLTHVELSYFEWLSDPPVSKLIQGCPKLVDLTLDGSQITDASLDLLALHSRFLRRISIKGCKKLSEAGLKALGQCGTLESVNASHASGVTDAALTAICEGNPGLKALVLSNVKLSDKSLQSVAMCAHLEKLGLNGSLGITNAGLSFIATGCAHLRFVSFNYSDHISDSGVTSLALGCPRLLKLRLNGCPLLSTPSVAALCHYCPKLSHLILQDCIKFSDDVFQHLLSAPSLRFVDLDRAHLTAGGILSYQEQKPAVEFRINGVSR